MDHNALALVADAKPSELIFLAQVVVLVVLGRLAGEGMQRIGQPAVMGQILAGLLLGPSVFGLLWPSAQAEVFPASVGQKAMLDGLATLGVLMLLLLTGMETDLRLVRRIGRPAITVSIGGILLPFLLGVLLGVLLPNAVVPSQGKHIVTALFLGTALSISSVKIVAMVVRELGFQRRNIGQILLASSVLDDTVAWIIIAVISSLAIGGAIDLHSVFRSTVGTTLFLLVSFAFGRQIVFRLIRWANDNLTSEMPVISMILAIMGVMALTTDAIGIHSVLGAFVAGMLVGNSPILTHEIDGALRGLITALFMPIFFGLAGLSADLTVLAQPRFLILTLGLVAIASVGKFGGAFLGGRLAGLTNRECLTLGCGMNARGSTEVIVATIALSAGAFDRTLYTMVVAMALVTTLAMPPMLRWALSRLPITEEERERLSREAFDEKSFVAGFERLLIAVDESANGQFASRLAGFIAGARGLPTTILHLEPDLSYGLSTPVGPRGVQSEPRATAETLKSTADTAKSLEASSTSGESPPDAVDVTARVQSAPIEEAVAGEGRKGYDLLVVGIENAVSPDGRLTPSLATIAEAFEGPLLLAEARGGHLENPIKPRFNILVPVTGTEVSRRALEIGLTIARSSNGRVTALYVSNKATAQQDRRFGSSFMAIRTEEAILRDAAALAEQFDMSIRTALSTHAAAEEAILRRLQRALYDLIVLGVTRRSGEELFFGMVAAAVLERAKNSILLVAS